MSSAYRRLRQPVSRRGGGRIVVVAALLTLTLALPDRAVEANTPTGAVGTLEGVLTLLWGDGSRDAPLAIGPIPILTDDSGTSVELRLREGQVRPLGGLLTLNGKRVAVEGTWRAGRSLIASRLVLTVTSVRLAAGETPSAPAAVTGSQPWVSVMCKFSDISTEPKNLSYFQNMFSSQYPGLDHYWRAVSYNNINVEGSTAHGWYTLPYPRSHYVDGSGNADTNALFQDCTAVADGDIYYPSFVGINLMFNSDIGPYAWGGNRWTTLDGVTRSWRVTWEPPWGYGNVCVMSHEMGHGFGFPHSAFDPSAVYDNAWDVMSDTWSYTVYDPTYGQVGQHTITFHKDSIGGWLRGPERVDVGVGDSTTVTLERTAQPTEPGPKEVRVPIGGSSTHFYTVEARKQVGYDVSTPGEAVIVHEVDTTREIPALVQGSDGAYGAMGTPGGVLRDAANDIGIAVTASTDTGFTVAVANGSVMAASSLGVDAHAGTGTTSNVNGILEPGETVMLEPAWDNASSGTVSPTGTASSFTGPAGATYTLADAAAGYGSVSPVTTASCTSTGNCYRIGVSNPATRPAFHWDATITETLSSGATKTRTLHIGRSFTDVPPAHWAYPYVENLFHNGITVGWSGSEYAPTLAVKRLHMAIFLARAMTGEMTFPVTGTVPGMGAYNCTSGGTSVFSDVPPSSGMCSAIHYIASRSVTLGCNPGQYCPYQTVKRYQMALFLARAMTGETDFPQSGTVPGRGAYNCSAGGHSVFSDVRPTDSWCTAVHFIASKEVTVGCGGDKYCPYDDVGRGQMAAFLVRAFGLTLYGP